MEVKYWKHLQNTSLWTMLPLHIGVVLIFSRDKSSLLLSKTFAVVDEIPLLISPSFLKSAVKNFCTFSSITGSTINGLSRIKLAMCSADGWFKVFSILTCSFFFSEIFSLSTLGWLDIYFGHILLLDLVHGPWFLAYFTIL